MIDTTKEQLLSLKEAAAAVPLVDGKKPNLSTIWRWMRQGSRGIQLEHVFLGRKICTSREALERFMHRVAEAPTLPRAPRAQANMKPRTASQREAAVEKAKQRLAENGAKVA